ncbi:MAG: hypothetical protein US60_C0026G0018 [Microgenomates group bacterium GW2011_GWC1_37_8]|uniref:2'-5' RNA ligase n=1 Tax=Candidatus Woesebacteria bacterium GW2011_GWB1_38_8 TaxID=1618570 RepID=A0A0G0NIG0_9BACT|nr:MAG: hypothetical protein US60_C0026G0018 [Microgenomates group bacterium GW2011_GWC1_37_8]KKQ85669.1 MAG: hypothetical protein UT08_C0005G0120 [Candidatus Woesebacteria bacterium GW2011_GWB1_38_8]
MRLNLVLLPNREFTQNIFNLRKQIIDTKLGNVDPRGNVLPHATILYFEEDITKEKMDKLSQFLNNLQLKQPITLDIENITNWEHRVVAVFNISPLVSLKENIELIVSGAGLKFNTEYKKTYGDTIGDHMKLVRQVLPEKTNEVISIFQNQLPKKVSFERIALVNYDTEEKDIRWEMKLPEKKLLT